jgi:recombination protein RecA
MSLEELVLKINKKYGKDVIFNVSENLGVAKIPRFSSGSLLLDLDLGGGWPENKIVEIFGHESSGKSFLLYKAISEVTKRKDNNKVVLIDEEGSFDINWVAQMGADLKNLQIVRSEYAEQALDILEVCTQSGEYGLVGLDSIAALIPKSEKDESTENWQMGLTARLMAKVCRKCYSALNSVKQSGGATTIFLINQLRLKIGVMFGNPEITTGGKSVQYASAIRVDVRKKEMLKHEDGEVYGQISNYTIVKNKTAPPLKKGSFSFFVSDIEKYKKTDIDNFRALIFLGLKLNYIIQKGKWYSGEWLEGSVDGLKGVIDYFRYLPLKEINQRVEKVEAYFLEEKNSLKFRF